MCLLPRPDAPKFLTSSCPVAHWLTILRPIQQCKRIGHKLDLGCFWLHFSEYTSKTTNLCIPMVRHMEKNHCAQRRKRFFPRVVCNGAIFWDCSTGGRPEVSWGIDFVVCQQALLYVLYLLQYISRCEMYVSKLQNYMLVVYLWCEIKVQKHADLLSNTGYMSDPTLSFAASRSTYRVGRKWYGFEWSYFNIFIFTMKEHFKKNNNFNRWDFCQNNFALICAIKYAQLPLLKNKFCKLFLCGMPTFHITNSDVTPP